MPAQSPAPAAPATTAPPIEETEEMDEKEATESTENTGETFPAYTVRKPEPLNEAGAVGLFSLLTPGGAEVRFTLRTAIGRELIDEILDVVDYARTKGFTPMAASGRGKAPSQSKPSSQKPPAASSGPAKPPASQPGTPDSGQPLTMDVVRMEVIPEEGDKVQVKWFEANHRFPDIYATWPVKKVVAILANTGAWEESHFASKMAYEVNYRITYKLGKLNTAGNPYKDILKIDPL